MKNFSLDDLRATVRVLTEIRAQLDAGNVLAVPGSDDPSINVYKALKAVVKETAAEGFLYHREQYYLPKRVHGQTDFGIGRVHMHGGFEKPIPGYNKPGEYLQRTALLELGAKVYVDPCPGFMYHWGWYMLENSTTMAQEHFGFPVSFGYRCLIQNPDALGDSSKGLWYPIGTLPKEDEMIVGRPGALHLMFLRACFLQHARGWTLPCINLNINPV